MIQLRDESKIRTLLFNSATYFSLYENALNRYFDLINKHMRDIQLDINFLKQGVDSSKNIHANSIVVGGLIEMLEEVIKTDDKTQLIDKHPTKINFKGLTSFETNTIALPELKNIYFFLGKAQKCIDEANVLSVIPSKKGSEINNQLNNYVDKEQKKFGNGITQLSERVKDTKAKHDNLIKSANAWKVVFIDDKDNNPGGEGK